MPDMTLVKQDTSSIDVPEVTTAELQGERLPSMSRNHE